MLSLTLMHDEWLHLGDEVRITISPTNYDGARKARIVIDAPPGVRIWRTKRGAEEAGPDAGRPIPRTQAHPGPG